MAIGNGDTVSVHYTGKLEDGQVFDSSEGREPLTFEMGSGMLIAGFESALKGKDVGDKVTATVPPEEGYGTHEPNLVQKMPRDRIQGTDLEVGQVLGLETEDGKAYQAQVVELDDAEVTLDFNHFLAGKTLTFDIEVVAVGN
jgi:peptidylprolyl isomerase